MLRTSLGLAAILLLASAGQAQTYAITGAKIYTLAGAPIPNGTIVIKDGKIAAVGAGVGVPSGARVIDAKGLQVYPGFFNAITQVGITEVGQGEPGTVDINELGDYNPQIVAATAVYPESAHIPVVRFTGVTHVMAVPGSGVISGQASAIHLAGWTIDDMLLRANAGLVLNWPSLGGRGFGGFGGGFGGARQRPFAEQRTEYERRVTELTGWLERARQYMTAAEKGTKENYTRDLKLEALIPYLKGELPVLVFANGERDIKNAVEFCEKQKLKMVLVGGRYAYKVKDLLKQKNVPVILGPSQALPPESDAPYDRSLTLAGELHAAGIKVAIATTGYEFARTLPFEAGNTVAYGMPWEEALKAITINPAQMLGLGDKIGTIEAGKIANLIIANGDPMEFRTEIRHVLIAGKPVSLDNKHKQLYEKYKARLAK